MNNIGSWIPQLFYDLIGRVVPGAFVMILGVVILQLPQKDLIFLPFMKPTEVPTTVVVLGGIVCSYTLGTLLGGLGFAGESLYRRMRKIYRRLRNMEAHPEEEHEKKPLQEKTSYRYDYILYHAPSVGARLAKLRAETHMCRVLMVGSIFLTVLYFYQRPPQDEALSSLFQGFLLSVFVMALMLKIHLASRSRNALRNNWEIVSEEKKKETLPATESN